MNIFETPFYTSTKKNHLIKSRINFAAGTKELTFAVLLVLIVRNKNCEVGGTAVLYGLI